MKRYTLITASMLLLLFSCKSHKDVSRSVTNQARDQSLVTVNDSLKTHLETSLKTDSEQQEDRVEYSKQTNFGTDSNVVSTTERIVIYASNLKFSSQLDQIKAEDFRYNGSTQSSNTSDSQLIEDIKESTDSRLIQGQEWAIIILTIVGVAIGLYMFYFNRRII